jgi:FkbM family methyltransferase
MPHLEELQLLAKRYANKTPITLPNNQDIWIFGAGKFGRDLCSAMQLAGFTVAGFVETTPNTNSALGLPVINWQQWSPNNCTAPLFIGIFNRVMPLDQMEALARQAGARNVFFPWDFYHAFKKNLGWRFWLSESEGILSQTDQIAIALGCLSDDTSKLCLLDIVAFRLGINTKYGSFQHTENQYFNPITLDALKGRPIRFVDGGAYNGDTYLELCSFAEVEKAYLFEPDIANFSKLVNNVRSTPHVKYCYPLGLSESYRILSFNSGNGEGSSITDTGNVNIAVASLDDMLLGMAVDFIKLDVEGAELQALIGSSNLIKSSRPVLALSLYHLPNDLWELPLKLAQLCEDYRLYIRQHHFNSFDSVLYAVPNKR